MRRKNIRIFAGLGAAAVILGGIALAYSRDDSSLGSTAISPSESRSPLAEAVDACLSDGNSSYRLGDDDTTLIIDGYGDDDVSGMPVTDEVCILQELHVSTAVTAQMESTTALQGRQTGQWSGYTATWTYHPDNGLDIIITQD